MGRRRELKGIANDISSFAYSRNFDYKGYWAIPKLYSAALKHKAHNLLMDISPDFENKNDGLDDFRTILANRVVERMISLNFNQNWLKNACFAIFFESPEIKHLHKGLSFNGKPFIITTKLNSDLGFEYQSLVGGYCFPHGQCTWPVYQRRQEYWGETYTDQTREE